MKAEEIRVYFNDKLNISGDYGMALRIELVAQHAERNELLYEQNCILLDTFNLQKRIADTQFNPEAIAEHNEAVGAASEKYFNAERQGRQMVAVQIEAAKAAQKYQIANPIAASMMPPARRG